MFPFDFFFSFSYVKDDELHDFIFNTTTGKKKEKKKNTHGDYIADNFVNTFNIQNSVYFP